MWWNSKTQIVMKLKNSNCDETQKLQFWQTPKFKLWQNSNTQIVTIQILKLRKKLDFDKMQNLKLWQTKNPKLLLNSNIDSNLDKSQFMKKKKTLKGSFSKNNLETLTINEMYSGQRFAILAMFSSWIWTFSNGRGGLGLTLNNKLLRPFYAKI